MDAYALSHSYDSPVPTTVVGFLVIDDDTGEAAAVMDGHRRTGPWHNRIDWAIVDTAERLGPRGSRIDAQAARQIIDGVNGLTLGIATIPLPPSANGRAHDIAERLHEDMILAGV
jgi:hypothetical protein